MQPRAGAESGPTAVHELFKNYISLHKRKVKVDQIKEVKSQSSCWISSERPRACPELEDDTRNTDTYSP